jgi:hypothetical protein
MFGRAQVLFHQPVLPEDKVCRSKQGDFPHMGELGSPFDRLVHDAIAQDYSQRYFAA